MNTNMTHALLVELANDRRIRFDAMSPEARDFMRANGNHTNTQLWRYSEWVRYSGDADQPTWAIDLIYKMTLLDEVINEAKLPWPKLSSLARTIMLDLRAFGEIWLNGVWTKNELHGSHEGYYRLNFNTVPDLCLNEAKTIFADLPAVIQAYMRSHSTTIEMLNINNEWEKCCPGFYPGMIYRMTPPPKPTPPTSAADQGE